MRLSTSGGCLSDLSQSVNLTAWACLCAALTVKYFFDHYNFTSAGAIASLVMGLLAKELWKRGKPAIVSGLF